MFFIFIIIIKSTPFFFYKNLSLIWTSNRKKDKGTLKCGVCNSKYEESINGIYLIISFERWNFNVNFYFFFFFLSELTKEVDVYYSWIDASAKINEPQNEPQNDDGDIGDDDDDDEWKKIYIYILYLFSLIKILLSI